MYSVSDKGELVLSKDVDLVKSGWTEKERENFSIKAKMIVNAIHGEYGELERNALQLTSLGRMALMFRKFIVPSVLKRYRKGEYSERMGDYTEGYYRSTGKFLVGLVRDFNQYKLGVLSHEWNTLSDHQKANIARTITEMSFAATAMILSGVFLRKAKDSDEDTAERELWALAAYQSLRFKSEMLMYTPKIDEAMSILKSPSASISTLEATAKLFSQFCNDMTREIQGEGFQTGKNGKLKILKDLGDATPGYRGIRTLFHTKDQLNFMDQYMVIDPMKMFQSKDTNQ
jgi:hypothetical protein